MSLFLLISLSVSVILIAQLLFALLRIRGEKLSQTRFPFQTRRKSLREGIVAAVMLLAVTALSWPLTRLWPQLAVLRGLCTVFVGAAIAVGGWFALAKFEGLRRVLTRGQLLFAAGTGAVLGCGLHMTVYAGFLRTMGCALLGGLVFTLTGILLADMRSRLRFCSPPRGVGMLVLTLAEAGLLLLACMGLTGVTIG